MTFLFYVPKGASKYVWTSDLISLGCVKTSSNNNRRRVAVTGECEAIEGRVNIIYYIIYVYYILQIYKKTWQKFKGISLYQYCDESIVLYKICWNRHNIASWRLYEKIDIY